jgi:protease IV
MRPSLLLPMLFVCAAGCGTPSFLITPIADTYKLNEVRVEPGKGLFAGKVAIIPVEGLLSNSRDSGLLGLGSGENGMSLFTEELDRAAKDSSVKAVVLRVNSPGGTVSSSDAMYQMVLRFRQKTGKPVVASIQEVGASGAYYVSCAADKIVAQPTSVVGSIGVIFETIEFEGTLAKLGIRADAVKSGTLKDMGSPLKSLEPNERAVMQGMIEEYFARFINVVRTNRSITEPPSADIATYAQAPYEGVYSGRVYSGERGVALGLVDQTGLLEDAIDLARQLSHSPDAEVIEYKRPYGDSGSIYADTDVQPPTAGVTRLELPGADSMMLPGGFYFLWRAGL